MKLVFYKKIYFSFFIFLFLSGCAGLEKKPFSTAEFENLINAGQIENIPADMVDSLKESGNIDADRKNILLARYYSTAAAYYYHKKDIDNYIAYTGDLMTVQPTEKNAADFFNEVYTNYYKNGNYSKTISAINRIESAFPKTFRELIELKIYAYYYSQNFYDVISLIQRYSKEFEFSSNFKKFIEKVKNEYKTELNFYEYNSGNYNIFYDNTVSYDTITALSSYLDQAVNFCSDFFGWYPDAKVSVLIYTASDYRSNINAPVWSSALFDGKIRIPVSANSNPLYLRTLVFHEYTHSIQFQKTNGDMISYWFAEGIAKLVETLGANLIYKETGQFIELNEIDSVFRNKQSEYSKISLSYYESYLIMKHLYEKYGGRAISSIAENYKKDRNIDKAFEKEIFMKTSELFDRIRLDLKREVETLQ
ncbi:MAG TPA: hypothetical protein PKY81_11345 [bacterium]|nr:hypothetical protein [bacterium]HPN31544.1 hypothetical protein [bacterium]